MVNAQFQRSENWCLWPRWGILPPWQLASAEWPPCHGMRGRQMAQRRCLCVYHRRPAAVLTERVWMQLSPGRLPEMQQENDACMQFSSTACSSLNLCPLPLSFNSSFCSCLFWLHTRHLPSPLHLPSQPSHLLCTMPPENLWNPLKFKCVLPLKMTLSLLFSIIEPPTPPTKLVHVHLCYIFSHPAALCLPCCLDVHIYHANNVCAISALPLVSFSSENCAVCMSNKVCMATMCLCCL